MSDLAALQADVELATRVASGDEAAFVALVREYGPTVTRTVARAIGTMRGASNDIDDVVQEVWVGVIRGIGGFEGRARLRTWIIGIAINQARRRFRTALKRNVHEDPYALPSDLDDSGRFDERGHWRLPVAAVDFRTPADELDAMRLTEVVDGCLARLPEKQRLALTLVLLDGLEPAEAATLLEVEDGNLRVLLHRARTAVRSAVENWRTGKAPAGSNTGGEAC